jgi:hypothetical protein
MVRRSPCEYYIKYLLVHPDNYSPQQIKEIVISQGLDYIGDDYVGKLNAGLGPRPIPYYPVDIGHKRSQRFLVSAGVRSMFIQDADMKLAESYIHLPRAKEIIETTSLSDMSVAWISGILRRAGYQSNKRSLDLYRHYYWNLQLVDSTDVKVLLRIRGTISDSQDPAVQVATAALGKAMYSDPRYEAAHVSTPAIASMMSLMRYGIIPNNIELHKLANSARKTALLRSCAETGNFHPHAGKQSLEFAMVAKVMGEVLADVGDTAGDLSEGLASMKMLRDENPVRSIAELMPDDDNAFTEEVEAQAELIKEETHAGP